MIRFHFMGLRPHRFSERVIAEMMGRISPDNRNLLWDYLGRRFINLSYKEADLFCQHSKEFMTSLFPPGEIYASLLPAEARNLIAKVEALGLSTGAENSLTGKLEAVVKLLGIEVGQANGVVGLLEAFKTGVEHWHSRSEISEEDRDELILDADSILLEIDLMVI